MARPIVTLTTDFGSADYYVGAMKGALLCAAPDVTLVDLSHEVPPQDVLAGAFLLRHAAGEFPAGTVHLGVVMPEGEYETTVGLPGDRVRLRNYAVISLLDFLRRRIA